MKKKLLFSKKRLLTCGFLLFYFLPAYQVVQAMPQLQVYAQDQQLKQEVENSTKNAYVQISSFIEDSLVYPLTIYVAEDEKDFKSKLGPGFPDWGVGVAISRDNLIILKSPVKSRYSRPFSEVLEHELAHLFLDKKSGGANLPRWIEEGFAMLMSKEWRIGQDITVAMAIVTGSVIPLSQIEDLNSFNERKAWLAYTESYLALSYFLEAYGKESFFVLLNYLSSNQSLDSSFLKTTGSSYLGFQIEFSDYLKKKYNFIAIFGDSFLFWLLLAFLLVFLYFMKKYHNRKTLKRWEYEDRIGKYGYYDEDQTQD